jgi:hypothetical protein
MEKRLPEPGIYATMPQDFIEDDSMHIIIDGYNMIRQCDSLRRAERLSLEAGRNALIHTVSLYKKIKGHKATIVFDGWEGGQETEERTRQEGINIIYSRRGEKADDVIKHMVEKSGEEMVIVTSDRNVADFAQHRGKTAVSSREFEALVERFATAPVSIGKAAPDAKDEEYREDTKDGTKKKGPSRRLSRKKKAALAALRKL